jgi:hypothetical protein
MKKSILQKPIKQVLISKGFEHVVEFFYKIKNQQIIFSTEKIIRQSFDDYHKERRHLIGCRLYKNQPSFHTERGLFHLSKSASL